MTTPAEVRDEVSGWLTTHWDPARPLGEWWGLLADSGWGFPHYPQEWFGRGLPAELEPVVRAAFRAHGAYGPPKGIATMMVSPLLLEIGTEEQKARWIPGIVRGTDIWCQLFSEPGAGSDLAGLSTRAVRDGDHWVVNGQKVWTSGGHYAHLAILVARTDPHVPKHRGLTFFVIDMDQPGVEPRPLVQMTGDAEFNEVFLTDAIVPAGDVIGDVNRGWDVTVRLLSHERSSLDPDAEAGIHLALDHAEPVGRYARGELDDGLRGFMPTASVAWSLLVDVLREAGADTDPVRRQAAAEILAMAETARYSAARSRAGAAAGRPPGPEASLAKLSSVRLMRAWRDLVLATSGPAGQLAGADAPRDGLLTQIALSVPGMSIAGGTDEIQRNIIGERVLGLPGEPRLDKDLPYSETRR
jgi:alkylation response protein AidB-like acyl-CoA dehydrogenase